MRTTDTKEKLILAAFELFSENEYEGTSVDQINYEDITAPDKAFYEIKGCGHTPQADKPEEVSNIIAELNLTNSRLH